MGVAFGVARGVALIDGAGVAVALDSGVGDTVRSGSSVGLPNTTRTSLSSGSGVTNLLPLLTTKKTTPPKTTTNTMREITRITGLLEGKIASSIRLYYTLRFQLVVGEDTKNFVYTIKRQSNKSNCSQETDIFIFDRGNSAFR